VVDLFSGCGGLTLGTAEAAHRAGLATQVHLAVDIDPDAVSVFRGNFPFADVRQCDVRQLFDGTLAAPLTPTERATRRQTGSIDVLVSGAPCQGHSDLNNHTRRRDPRNALYLTAARAVVVLRPSFALLENVPAVQRDAGGVVGVATNALREAGYSVASTVVNLLDLGIPQTRRRHLLVASSLPDINPQDVLDVASPCSPHLPRTVRWAIRDLEDADGWAPFDTASTPSNENARRISWLFDNRAWDLPNRYRPACHHGDHSYVSMYGRLKWHGPAQTIATGFGSMGQGRYVHPSRRRTLTPHEAARLQTFPDFFDFGDRKRRSWAAMIGNAVPPLVVLPLIGPVLPSLLLDRASAGAPPAGAKR
jgi:DNA (cytosine-5)-methyltransferase 1